MKKKQDDSGGVPEWLVTFGDMMSLLLTFFIMLFSMSEIKKDDKFHAMVESLRKTFGYENADSAAIPGDNPAQNSLVDSLANLARAKRLNLMQGGAPVDAPVGENPQVLTQEDKGDPDNQTAVFFAEGSTRLTDEAKNTLDQFVKYNVGIPQMLEIRGHTSNRPLPEGGPFEDHFDLAVERAKQVAEYLEAFGVNPKRFRISAAAGNELKYKGTDRVRQAENARVDIRVLRKKFDQQSNSKSLKE